MQLKFTPDAAKQMKLLLECYNKYAEPPDNPDDKLIQLHMASVYEKLRTRMMEARKNYNISIKKTEALAYWIFFRDLDLTNWEYERNFINQQVAQMAQAFGDSTYNDITNYLTPNNTQNEHITSNTTKAIR